MLDEVITDRETNNSLEIEIDSLDAKINSNKMKMKNLLDMVISEYITKDAFKDKKYLSFSYNKLMNFINNFVKMI